MSQASAIARRRRHDDLVARLSRLNDDLLIELGEARPKRRTRLDKKSARCPTAHNRALLDGTD